MLKILSSLKKFINNKLTIITENEKDSDSSDMNVRDIIVLPLDNKTSITHKMRECIYSVLEKYNVMKNLHGYKSYYIRITNQIPLSVTTIKAYHLWKDPLFSQIETPFGLPRQQSDSVCLKDIWLLRIECVNKNTISYRSGGWGFDGYVLNILVDSSNLKIWDARGEKAF